MNNIFRGSLSIIGGVLGAIIGLTIGFALNTYSLLILYGIAVIFAIVGATSLSRLSSAINNQDINTKKILTILCAITAVILLALLALTITMLNTYFSY